MLAFVASIILPVQSKGNRNDHGEYMLIIRQYSGNNCNVWNCNTIIAGNVGYFYFSINCHTFANHLPLLGGSIQMLIARNIYVMCLKFASFDEFSFSNHVHNIRQFYKVLVLFPFTTSKRKLDV